MSNNSNEGMDLLKIVVENFMTEYSSEHVLGETNWTLELCLWHHFYS